MIAANGLRIGNWIMDDDTIRQWSIYDYTLNPLSYAPISLSPEILEKCGFKNDHSTFEYADGSNNEKLFISWIDGEYVVELQNGEKNISIELKYLHQLQNLYFALTQTELIINL
jgi:hypothetical protein